MKTAIVIGATGLVGSNLVKQLFEDERFGKIIAFTGRKTGLSHDKLEDSSQQAAENALAIAVQSELLMSVLRTSSLPTTPTSFPSSTTGNV